MPAATIDADARAPVAAGPELLITAAEAFPAFERAVLAAEDRIVGGFRIFDLSTRLRTPEARAVGVDWFDLLLHKLRQGVRVDLLVSDFDPVFGTELHGSTWRTMRMAGALAELAPAGARLRVRASLHPAAIGNLARLALWPRVHGALVRRVTDISRGGEDRLARFMDRHPHLSALLVKAGGRHRPRFWPAPRLWPVTHHQKAAAIDGRLVYLGGLDLNERRWDTPDHERAAEETWHDVQLLLRDAELARAVETHLEELTDVIEGEAEPSDLGGALLRTVSARRSGPGILAPRSVLSEIEAALHDAIASAERQIYVETQFLRDRRTARRLARAARLNPDLELILILPAAPEDVAFEGAKRVDARYGEFLQASCIRKLRRAFRGRLFIGSPARPVTARGAGRDTLLAAPIIYVHAKVMIVDGRTAIVGSANLNGRSLRWDTELAVRLSDPAVVGPMRERLMRHWLKGAADGVPELLAPAGAVRSWQRLAVSNARTRPEGRKGLMLPHLTRPSRRFGKDVPAVPEEMV
jgi:phospholipase D1/2